LSRFAFDNQNVTTSLSGEVVRDAGTDDSSTNDDNVRSLHGFDYPKRPSILAQAVVGVPVEGLLMQKSAKNCSRGTRLGCDWECARRDMYCRGIWASETTSTSVTCRGY
jgi:hypothetical protein